MCLKSVQVSMNRLHVFMAGILSLLATLGWANQVSAYAIMDELVAAARKEGVVNLNAPTAIGAQATQELGAAFNQKYGLNIRVNYLPTRGFTRDVAQVISQSAMGVPLEWDLMVITENLHAHLWQKRLHRRFNYRVLGVDSRAVHHDNGSVAIAHGIVLPTYNSKALADRDIPRAWADLLDSKWKEGKLGVSDATYFFALLAAGPWGEDKTMEFVRALARQRPFIGRMSEIYTRLELREIFIASMLPDNFVHRATMAGAPIVHAEGVEPVLILPYNIGVLERAAHPNAAHLFTAFMVTPEAQAIWEKYSGQTSAFVPGTKTNKFLKGKETIFMGGHDPTLVERLSQEYSRILGFTR